LQQLLDFGLEAHGLFFGCHVVVLIEEMDE
jgi:hypothetical protein